MLGRKKSQPVVGYNVQVIKSTFTNEMIKEITKAEFFNVNSTIDEVIIVDKIIARQVLSIEKWPFSIKLNEGDNIIYIAYANNKSGVTKIDCLFVDKIDSELEADLHENNGIIRITKDI